MDCAMASKLRILLAALLLLSAPLGSGAQAKTEVRLAVLAPSALLWLHAIAREEGFYADADIEVKELIAGSSPALLQAVSSGSVEAGVSLGDLVIRAIDQGAPITITGAVMQKTNLRLIGGPGITSVDQLKGATVTAGAVEGGTANLLRFQLQRNGLDPRAVQLVALTNSRDRLVALENGQVKAALLLAPFDTLALRQGMQVLDVYKEPYVQTPLIVNTNWARDNRRVAVALTQAFKKAADWIYDPNNRTAAINILAAYTGVAADVCADSYKFLVEDQQSLGRGLVVQAAGLENILAIDRALGGTPATAQHFDLARYYDPSFLVGK
jgi:ABC-type nitrate/sulfonate/bicarbonate transport system substrate-binding protein